MKKKIALVTGGYSGEAVISYKSAITIENNIDKQKWDCYKIDINQHGWFYQSLSGEKISVDKNDFSITEDGDKITFDAVLIGMHGTPGEDGKLQGYFDCLKIPYTSCDAATSALTFNKRYTVAVAAFVGIHVARSLHLFKNNPLSTAQILNRLRLPLFIKPNNGGSSVGMSKVHNIAGLPEALKKAFNEDDQVLVEEFIKGREFSRGIARLKGKITVLPATEIISFKEFFDYEAKYTAGASEEITPADLSPEINDKIAEILTEIYLRLNCKGMVRIDFILLEDTLDFYFIEVNTTPGQSAASLIPQQVRAAGMDLGEFYGKLIV